MTVTPDSHDEQLKQKWALVGHLSAGKSAFGSAFIRGRYLVTLGGIIRTPNRAPTIVYNTIEVCDILNASGDKPLCQQLTRRLSAPRFGMMATSYEWPDGSGVVVICGGKDLANKDDEPTCELFSFDQLLADYEQLDDF